MIHIVDKQGCGFVGGKELFSFGRVSSSELNAVLGPKATCSIWGQLILSAITVV